jgi:hypothetical protein
VIILNFIISLPSAILFELSEQILYCLAHVSLFGIINPTIFCEEYKFLAPQYKMPLIFYYFLSLRSRYLPHTIKPHSSLEKFQVSYLYKTTGRIRALCIFKFQSETAEEKTWEFKSECDKHLRRSVFSCVLHKCNFMKNFPDIKGRWLIRYLDDDDDDSCFIWQISLAAWTRIITKEHSEN